MNKEKWPFNIKHELCLVCQQVPGKPHLCSSCQWHTAMGRVENTREHMIAHEVQDILRDLDDLNIYLDEPKWSVWFDGDTFEYVSIESAIRKIAEIVKEPVESEQISKLLYM